MDKNTLFSYMPKYYKTSKVLDDLNNANAIELTFFKSKLNDVLNQFFIDSADFSLERWEKELGIDVNNNYNVEYRRSRILSKLRGQGTITVKLIKEVAESYNNGIVDVIEDNPSYSFIIKFISNKGVPPNIDDLKAAIDEIKPAHLAVIYEFTYNTWDMVSGLTWGGAINKTWNQLREDVI
ncbi:putative phage tail protein [Clostridium sulfidigenes]|nr:putative phage tail protein [Clostridium sulfidigenes]